MAEHFIFHHPLSMIIAGPSQSGKSVFVGKLLENPEYIQPTPEAITWFYGAENQEQFETIKQQSKLPITFIEGVPDSQYLIGLKHHLIILDDLMEDIGKSKEIANLFTKGCHHRNISVILILQNIFHQDRKMKSIRLNAKYTVLFKNPNDALQIRFMGRQMFPKHPDYLQNAYEQATKRQYGYLIIDSSQQTPDNE